MKKILPFSLAFLFIVALLALILFAVFKKIGSVPDEPKQNTPAQIYIQPSGTTTVVQPAQLETQVSQDFHSQVSDSDKVYLSRVVLVDKYVIADWTDGYTGGMTVFMQDASGSWKIILMDGGVIDVTDMVRAGVPEQVAQQLQSNIQNLEQN